MTLFSQILEEQSQAASMKTLLFKDRLISAGVSPETAEIEACRLEHCVSEESFHKLRKTYGY